MPVHVIAEAGSNHNGDQALAFRLVDAASKAGADSVKFQLIYPEGLYVPTYVDGGEERDNPVFARRSSEVLADADWRAIAGYSRRSGIPFSASVFDRKGVDLLVGLDPPYLKVASTDLNNYPLLEIVAECGIPVVVSTGMSSLGEIEGAVDVFRKASALSRLSLLHCVSVYPCPLASTNLGMIRILREAFGVPVGFSDHTEGSLASCMAVALGATIVEKHFTLDKTMVGFDHLYAAEPLVLEEFVADVRAAEQATAFSFEKVSAAERETRVRAGRGLYAARDLPSGHVLGKDDILVVRPSAPLQPKDLGALIGVVLSEPVRANQAFQRRDVVVGAEDTTWKAADQYWRNEMGKKGITHR
jgi:N,N'-diacetyllegionaminate synthase